MKIKTLAEILAETDTVSASSVSSNSKSTTRNKNKLTKTELFHQKMSQKNYRSPQEFSDNSNTVPQDSLEKVAIDEHFDTDGLLLPSCNSLKKKSKKQKRFHPASNFVVAPNNAPIYKPLKAQSIKEMLCEVKEHGQNDQQLSSSKDNLPVSLKAYLRTPEQKQAELDAIKAESRLRWLAFYYLSRREYGKAELKQKLIDKEQALDKIDALLDEFEEKGYQSDYRTTLMLIRESIRKGRGRGRIKREFYNKKIAMPSNIDELIDMANTESDEFSEFIDDNEDSLVDGVDWLKLAVTARTKKYGATIPTGQKDKAKQLRFLQYRGFNVDICFAALNYTLETLDERF